jgi:hypothetical protein
MSNNEKLWELYPDIWATKAAFFTYLRGSLRRALWERYPVKLQFKNEAVSLPPDDYFGRAKSGTYCALTGEWEGKSKLEVDHITGNASLKDWDDVLPFIRHLCATKDDLQLVTKPAHKIKSYADRMGISFEEAAIIKNAIAICKDDAKGWLVKRGIDPASNANKRRAQVELCLRKGV